MAKELLHEAPALDKHRSQRYGIGMIEQVAKLQSDVEYIKGDVAEMKTDIREIRGEIREIRTDVHKMGTSMHEMRGEFRDHQDRDFRILFGAIIAVAIGLTGVLARSFGWL